MPGIRLFFEAEVAQALAKINEVTASFHKQRAGVSEAAAAISVAGREAVDAEVKKQAALRTSIGEYGSLARAAKSGSAEQVAANKLAADSARQLGVAYKEAGAAAATSARHAARSQEESGIKRGFVTKATGVGGAFAGPGFVAGAIGGVAVVKIVEETLKAQESQKLLQNALRNTGQSWAQYRGQINETLEKQERLSGFSRDELRGSLGLLERATHNTRQATRLLADVTDVARGRHIALTAATLLMTKASQGNVGALRRLGIDVSKTTVNMDALRAAHIKVTDANRTQVVALTKHAKELDLLATRTLVLDKVESTYHGAAAARSKSLQGRIDALHNTFRELAIEIGTRLIPPMTRLLERFQAWVHEVSTSQHVRDQLHSGLRLIGEAAHNLHVLFSNLVTTIKILVGAVGGTKHAFELLLAVMAISKFRAIGIAIQTSLTGSIDKARTSMKLAEGESVGLFTTMKIGARTTSIVIKSALISTGIGAVVVALGIAVELIITHWSKVKAWLRDFGNWIKTRGLQMELDFVEPFSHLPGHLGRSARAAKERINAELQHMDAVGMKAGTALSNGFTAASKEKMAALPKWVQDSFQVKLAFMMANAGTVAGANLVANLEAQLKTLPGWAQKQIAPQIQAAILGAAAQDAPGSSTKGQVGTGQHARASGTRANPAPPKPATLDLKQRIQSETGATASTAEHYAGHATGSFHYSGQALDITGSHPQLIAAWNLLFPHRGQLAELYWNGGGFWKNGAKIGAAGSNTIPKHDTHIHVAFTGTKQELDIGFDPKAAGSATAKPKDASGKGSKAAVADAGLVSDAAKLAVTSGKGKKRAAPSGRPMFGQTLVNYIATRSKALGLDPAAVLAVASVEGGFNGTVGDHGTSFGPFQLHAGGALPDAVWAHGAIYARAWANTPAGVDHALKEIAAVAGGATGAGAVSLIVSKFERPAAPGAEIAKASGRLGSTKFKIDPRGMQGARDARAPSATPQTGLRGAIDAIIKVFKDLGPTVRIHLSAAALEAEKHLEALRKSITINMGPADLARTRVAMGRWKKVLTDGIKAAQAEAQGLIDVASGTLSRAWGRLESLALKAIDRMRAPARKAIEEARGETPTEKIIRAHDEAQTQRGLTQSLGDAQKRLGEATTPEEAAAAQADVDEAVYQQWLWDNRKLIAAESDAADKARDDALQAFDDQTEDYKAGFTDRLAVIKSKLANGVFTQAQALKATKDLFKEYKLPTENAAGELANALSQAIVAAVQALTDAINVWLEAMGLIPGVVSKVKGISGPSGPDPRAVPSTKSGGDRPGGVQVPLDNGVYGAAPRVGGAQDPEPIVITVNVNSNTTLDGAQVADTVANTVTRRVRRGGFFLADL